MKRTKIHAAEDFISDICVVCGESLVFFDAPVTDRRYCS
jgi:hypothetical protein